MPSASRGAQGYGNPQQPLQGRFAGQSQLQPGLQQLNSYQARPGVANGTVLGNIPGGSSGVRANPAGAGARPPGMDGYNPANNGLSNLGGGQANIGMPGYSQNPPAASLGNQQVLNMGMNRTGAPGMNNLQNLQNARAGLNSNEVQQQPQQQGLQGSNLSQDLLSMIGRAKQLANNQGAGGAGAGSNMGGQQQQQQSQQGSTQIASADSDFPPLEKTTDFPSLVGSQGQLGQHQQSPPGGNAELYAGLRKAVAGGAAGMSCKEFSMQDQDFPALPGASAPHVSGRGGLSGIQQGLTGLGGSDQFQGQHFDAVSRFQQHQPGGPGAGKSAPPQDRSLGASGTPDRFSLLGLLPVLKANDPDLTMLVLGADLTSLGLNLSSSENLCKKFVSPISDTPVKHEPEFELPACYHHAPQRLQPGYLAKFKEETLFYMFYAMPQDEAQLIAADELSSRSWWFHKRLRMWMIHVPNAAKQKTQRGERGSYLVFDPMLWEVVQKGDMEIIYEDIEQPPRLLRPKHLLPHH